ncbi:YfiR family protein [Neptunomonas japonica]|uniref:Transmembrane protein n=1 Tax=Neptunomonas japonica JAMM 1380 TaxID=1441457 RepID=A0A7R6P9G0_9GAMM|nr:YfiR family protein [Neptunomonas japonica]BBB29704.1 conserved hypothetical protein [Neptunomonas japonica JAMM 1380]
MLALTLHKYFRFTLKIHNYIALFLVLIISSAPVFSANLDREMILKSGFIYNFSRFGKWESDFLNQDSFTICSPDKTFTRVAKITLDHKKVKRLPIVVNEIGIISDINKCSVVFVTKKYYLDWKNRLSQLGNEQVMLIGENKGFIRSGGHINFFILSGKIRFEVSVSNLKKSGLLLSSKVLRLGRIHE